MALRSEKTNNHCHPGSSGPQNQLFAYDFRLEETGKEKDLADYLVFGIEVIAPGNGQVVQVVNGAFDCEPGKFDRSIGVGNMVIIYHGSSEYSLLCHLRHNSIVVSVGDEVKQGQKLGLCGNTENTSRPHIHYNLQDSIQSYEAKALPIQFKKIIVDGEVKTNFEPVRFQKVSNP